TMEIGVSAAGRALLEVDALAPQRRVTPGLHPSLPPSRGPSSIFPRLRQGMCDAMLAALRQRIFRSATGASSADPNVARERRSIYHRLHALRGSLLLALHEEAGEVDRVEQQRRKA